MTFIPVAVNRNPEYAPPGLPECYGGNERYLYNPNWYDQTVSVIDTDLAVASNRNTLGLTSLVRATNVVTATTVSPHGKSTNDVIWITGATGSTGASFQGAYSITVTGASTFTYSNSGSDGSAGGTMFINWWTSNPVVATITLTAAKNFCAIMYRAVDDSVYVFGTSYFDRIDANPDSGTFNTIVESGAAAAVNDSVNLTYLPWPLDMIANSGSNYRFIRFANKNDTAAALADYNMYATNSGSFINGSSGNLGLATFGHAIGWARLAPKAGIMFFRSEQSYKYRILHSKKGIQTNGEYTFVQESWQMDLDRIGMVGNGYIFGNVVLPGSSGSIYKQLRGMDVSPIGIGGLTSGGVTPNFNEYCPIYGKGAGSGRLTYAGKSGVLISVFDIGFNVYSDLGDIDRIGHRGSTENATDLIMFNHRNNTLFARPYTTLTLPGVVNLLHVYDITQALGSMYVGSVPVGNVQSATTTRGVIINNMTFNQTKYYEATDVIL